jgi:hypothetical protein
VTANAVFGWTRSKPEPAREKDGERRVARAAAALHAARQDEEAGEDVDVDHRRQQRAEEDLRGKPATHRGRERDAHDERRDLHGWVPDERDDDAEAEATNGPPLKPSHPP